MGFDEAYQAILEFHRKQRDGVRLERLIHGHGHAEKLFLENVWWPAFDGFENLHPEYEISDFKDGTRYLDFAYFGPFFKLAIEIDGFGSHWKNIDQ